MAIITNYASLSTAVGDYLARSDLTGFVPNFIQNAESKLYRTLRLRTMETALSGTISGGVLAVPSGYLELKYAYVNQSPTEFLSRMPPEALYREYPNRSNTARPRAIAREASNFIFGPYPDANYSIAGIYYTRLTSLDAITNTTNWFTDNAPDVLLYGALLEAVPFLKDDERIPVWRSYFDEAVGTVRREENRENSSGSSPQAVAA